MKNTTHGLPVSPTMKWWGWGAPDRCYPLVPAARAHFRSALLLDAPWPRQQEIAGVRLPASHFDPEWLTPRETGLDLRTSIDERVRHAAGRSYRDLVRLRSGLLPSAPDAVAYPDTPEQLQRLLALAAERDWVCVPFGGGTSVVGGVEACRGPRERPLLALDLSRLARVIEVDELSRTATVEAGIFGPALESALALHGLTLGHFPQSFEFSTVGGWVATRSAGQASTGYGRIDDRVLGLAVTRPSGVVQVGGFPGSAAGPDMLSLYLGSEGRLGVIHSVTLRLHPAPSASFARAILFRSFAEGCHALREVAVGAHPPTVIRLSDEAESETFLRISPPSSSLHRAVYALGRQYLARRGYPLPGSSIMLLTTEGEERVALKRMRALRRMLVCLGGLDLGSGPAEKWRRDRFSHPYLRDELLDMGIMVDTLETCTTWAWLPRLYGAVASAIRQAIAARGSRAIVLCHVSHLYEQGASLYFTFFGRVCLDDPEGQWQEVKNAASEAILRTGGTITHHHAVGYEHRPWFAREVGADNLRTLRLLAAEADPSGILNPGKLIA
jgi:alkyldihydroxyacetonephosphate synthase